MKYAVIETSGSQFQVTEGQIIEFDRVDQEAGSEVTFDKVMLLVDGDKIEVGATYVEGHKVSGEIVEHFKDKKLYIYKYKAKSRYRRKTGHRQEKTRIKINKIS